MPTQRPPGRPSPTDPNRAAWATLGEMLGVALVDAEGAIARRFASEIEARLQYFKVDKALRAAVKKVVGGECDIEGIVKSFGYWGETRDLMRIRSLIAMWEELTGREDFDPGAAWRELEQQLREILIAEVEKGLQTCMAARGFEAELARLREQPLALWPLEEAGDLRERVRAWRDAAVKRGVKKTETIDPDLLPSRMTLRWAPATIPVANLATWLDDHASWSRALAIVLPLLMELRD